MSIKHIAVQLNFEVDTKLSNKQIRMLIAEKINEIKISNNLSKLTHTCGINDSKNGGSSVDFLGEFDIDEIFSLMTEDKKYRDVYVGEDTYSVLFNNPKYFVLKENRSCVVCGLKGTKLFLEKSNFEKPHFNLYGEKDGKLILLTKDHIIAKSQGGKNYFSNFQTMCTTCNALKGNSNIHIEDMKSLKSKHDEITNKKEFSNFIEKFKKEFSKPLNNCEKVKKEKSYVETSTDLHIFLNQENEMEARLFAEDNGILNIGCIRRGTHFKPILEINRKVICQISENSDQLIVFDRSLLKVKKKKKLLLEEKEKEAEKSEAEKAEEDGLHKKE